MEDLPVLKPVGQLSGLQQIVRIVRVAVLGLFAGEGLIDEDPSFADPPFVWRDERPVEVVEDQNRPVILLLKRIPAGFQVDLPEFCLEPPVFCGPSGHFQRFMRTDRQG